MALPKIPTVAETLISPQSVSDLAYHVSKYCLESHIRAGYDEYVELRISLAEIDDRRSDKFQRLTGYRVT